MEGWRASTGMVVRLPVAVVVGTPVSLRIQVTFHPPNARRRDVDNLIASIKPHLDGISDAIGIDDSRWIWAAPVMAKPEKPGRVVVTLTPVEVR